jgi:isoquinoline 1-oxidoreductase alpha subunit
MTIELDINGKTYAVASEPDTPLLWVLRDELHLTGTKYGCGIAACGACTVHLNGTATRACQLPISGLVGMKITTIEGLNGDHPIQAAWVRLDVPQCGYCQSGQIMSAVALVKDKPHATDDDIDAAMAGNICRCGCYPRIRAAIKHAVAAGDPVKAA